MKKINKDLDNKKGVYKGWTIQNDFIFPSHGMIPTLDKGYYSISSSSQGYFFIKQKLELNKLYKLPNSASDTILNDISKFWELEEAYKKYNRVFRRNYLIYSEPGTGKTSLINIMSQELINKYNGIAIYIDSADALYGFCNLMSSVREIEPNRKVIAIIEDFDSYLHSRQINSTMLNILDGNLKFGNVVTIATTNHIEMLDDSYVNRPSRFDIVIKFPLPNKECRRMFLEKSIHEDDIKKININEWVEKTDGYTIDHLNELVLLHFVFSHPEEECFNKIDNMIKNSGKLNNKKVSSSIGFDYDGDYKDCDDDGYGCDECGEMDSSFGIGTI